jgi:hypothetical protein
MTTQSLSEGIKGKYVALGLFILTAIVGSLFIYLGPRATKKSPGVVHIGIRYENEQSLAFLNYGKTGPDAKIEFIAPDGSIAYTFERLKLGRNLMPLQDLDNGPYSARISALDFQTVEVPIIVEGRMLNPPKDARFTPGTYADYNMIGVRFVPIEP